MALNVPKVIIFIYFSVLFPLEYEISRKIRNIATCIRNIRVQWKPSIIFHSVLKVSNTVHCNLGPVVWRPISANPRLDFNPALFFFLSKALSRIIFSILFRVSNHQIVDKKSSTEFAFYAFMSSFIFRTNPGLSQPSCEQPSRGVYPPGTLDTRYPPPPPSNFGLKKSWWKNVSCFQLSFWCSELFIWILLQASGARVYLLTKFKYLPYIWGLILIQFNLYVTKAWPREWQNMFHRMGLSKSIFIHFTISKADNIIHSTEDHSTEDFVTLKFIKRRIICTVLI